jgi:vacuolar protein sorting-associated protein IST1
LFLFIYDVRVCDPAISEAVNTLIYAAPRTDVAELLQIRDQLAIKYGEEFATAAMENQCEVVNPRVSDHGCPVLEGNTGVHIYMSIDVHSPCVSCFSILIVCLQVVHKLRVQTPETFLVNQYLRETARAYNISWEGDMTTIDTVVYGVRD